MESLGLRLLDIDEVMAKSGLRRTAIYERIKKGSFPAPISLGARTSRWRSDAVDKWIEDLTARARAAA